MNQLLLVSIIIPNYNYASYLEECINSVIGQTYKNIEIIIIDDCSNDNSIEIIENLQQKFDIKLIRNTENSGVSFSRNKGIEAATGEYICFLDPDDTWYPEKLERQVTLLLQQNSNLCFADIDVLKGGKITHTRKHRYKSYTYKDLLKRNFIPLSTLIINSNLVKNLKYRNIESRSIIVKLSMKLSNTNRLIHEDYAFLLELFRTQEIEVSYVAQPLVIYRLHQNNYSKSYIKKLLSLYTIYRINEKYNTIMATFLTLRIAVFATLKNLR